MYEVAVFDLEAQAIFFFVPFPLFVKMERIRMMCWLRFLTRSRKKEVAVMPDWSYQTIFRPLLFRLPSRLARELTLRAMGRLSRLPGGAFVIRTLGHMEPSPLLESRVTALTFPTPVGLSGSLDPEGTAHKAMSQFGFGFMEVGPVTVSSVRSGQPIVREAAAESIVYPAYAENPGLKAAARRIAKPGHTLPQLVRIAPMPGTRGERALEELRLLRARLAEAGAAGFYIDVLRDCEGTEEALALLERIPGAAEAGRPLFLYVSLDYPNEQLERLLERLDRSAWAGIVVGEALPAAGGGVRIGKACKAAALEKLRAIRRVLGPGSSFDRLGSRDVNGFAVKAAGGVHEPQDAVDLMRAGADYVLLHSGLVYAGPGLPKRVNEAVLYEKIRGEPEPLPPSFWKHWGWMCLLGLGMIFGGILAWLVATTTVLLPYDEAYLGMDLEELSRINANLLHFMSHDRITLAGTMISIGILYYQIAANGLQHGLHWSKTALAVSGVVGFSSFFLYLGYGYFDPLHAITAAALLPMFVLSMRNNPDRPYRKPVNRRNDRVWRLAMWGQLCFVVLGFALAAGGITIAVVGMTQVFVPEDLAFMQVTPAELEAANPHLIPLIAHDRAGFGGALLSDALALLIMALWGLQQGERWQWKTLLVGGAPGFIAGFGVHLGIGYTDFWHLLPALFALALYVAGLILLYPYLMRSPQTQDA